MKYQVTPMNKKAIETNTNNMKHLKQKHNHEI